MQELLIAAPFFIFIEVTGRIKWKRITDAGTCHRFDRK
jgi:hypothetical protein